MSIELRIPDVGESIQEVQIGRWLKREGDSVAADESVAELETDKASVELPAPADGVLSEIRVAEGETASVGDVVAILEESEEASDDKASDKRRNGAKKKRSQKREADEEKTKSAGTKAKEGSADEEATAAEEPAKADRKERDESQPSKRAREPFATPSARRELQRYGLSAADVQPAGERIRPEDVRRHVAEIRADEQETEPETAQDEPAKEERRPSRRERGADQHLEEVVPMSAIRRRIAQRLVEAQQRAALLTTFNDVELSQVIALRRECGEAFRERYGVKLGFMSFFVKAVIDALKAQPVVNAEIRGDDIVYRNYYHIGVAVGGGEGLVVPVLRHAEHLSFAEIEKAIDDFARRAQSRKLEPDELQGGTFTISNGGVYGSLLSTPIVNPPQSAILGMHAIEDRPVARAGEVVIRPMMYVALTYDHRLVDGREAVLFLKRIKEAVEQPSRMLIEV